METDIKVIEPTKWQKIVFFMFFNYWSEILEHDEFWRNEIKKKVDWLGEPPLEVKEKKDAGNVN